MAAIKEVAQEFLSAHTIAVTGVSRMPTSHGGNVVYKRLRDRGYQVYAVNPNADMVEGDRAYPNLRAVPASVEAVVIATRPQHAMDTMRECVELGIKQVWMHRAMGPGSVSDEATQYGREHGLRVIDGGCPLMFPPVTDGPHRFLRGVCRLNRKLPAQVP